MIRDHLNHSCRRTTMFTSIAGRSVLVTGGTKGIGKGIARVFARAGANVVVCGRDTSASEAVQGEASGLSGSISFVHGDVGLASDCERVVSETVTRYGGLDVLCANAGVYPSARIEDMTEADIDAIFATNVKGSILMVRACTPALERSGRGRIILTSSITGPITRAPGSSPFPPSLTAPPRAEPLAQMTASIPAGRLGSAEDVGNACLFLATEEAAYITGQTIVVDGGQVLPESLAALEVM